MSTFRGSVRQPESVRLQNDIEALTKAVGLQQRRAASLDERVQHYSREIKAKRERIRALLPSDETEMMLRSRLAALENHLQRETVVLNRDLVQNQRIREKIDAYRRDKVTTLGVFHSMQTDSSALQGQAQEANKAAMRLEGADERWREQLQRLKQRSESALGGLQSRAELLQGELELDKRLSRSPIRAEWLSADSRIFYDNNQILKCLYSKWSSRCKDQKKAVDQYTRSVQYLSNAFREIKEATGIARIGEMVTGLVKAQQQEQVLLENLNKVMALADGLEGRVRELRGRREDMENSKESSLERNQEQLSALNAELRGLKSLFQRKVAKQSRLRKDVESLDAPIQHLLTLFRESLLRPSRHKSGRRELDVLGELGRLEKEISFLLKYLSLGKGEIPAILDTELLPKDFEEGRSELKAQAVESSGKEEAERPLSAREIRSRARLKFEQMHE